jgi:hypothetical protein
MACTGAKCGGDVVQKIKVKNPIVGMYPIRPGTEQERRSGKERKGKKEGGVYAVQEGISDVM